MRKHLLKKPGTPAQGPFQPGEKNVRAMATVFVTSESAAHPVENAFDDRRGPGGSRWVADEDGEQTLILAFDSPEAIRQICVEIEEQALSRTQELSLAMSDDGGETYRERVRQEFTFSPPGTTFERELWALSGESVTHLKLVIKPDKGNKPSRATLTSLIIW
jgi:hypothetical protein